MAPTLEQAAEAITSSVLAKRYYYYCSENDSGCTSWYYWGRWVFAGIVVIAFILLFALWGCISSRRRRRQGQQPLYGTGWMAPPKYPGPPGQGPGIYGPPPPAYGGPPPQQPVYTGTSFNTAQGYYGHHEGIQMTPQPPQNAYHRQDDYAPPAGPPPPKN